VKTFFQILVIVYFAWQPNTEPDMSHYRLYQRIGSSIIRLKDNIPHPAATTNHNIPTTDLAIASYYLTAVDTEGFESEPSLEYDCSEQWCIDKYLSGNGDPPENATETAIKTYE